MSGPSWTVPAPTSGVSGLPPEERARADGTFFGEDVWYDIAQPDVALGEADYVTTAHGDLATATGIEALRQSLIRRIVTRPGDWPTLPDYGVGALDYVKAINSAAVRAELEGRIRSQFKRDRRVLSVELVTVAQLDDGSSGVKISVLVTPAGRLRTDRQLPVQVEIR